MIDFNINEYTLKYMHMNIKSQYVRNVNKNISLIFDITPKKLLL